MKARSLLALTAFAASIWIASCSSGLGNNLPQNPQPSTPASANLPVGFDLGLLPTAALETPAAAGVVVPAIGSTPARDVVLLAFATTADAADGDGAGTPLCRDAITDGNGAADVFVAAVSAQDVETRAFSQALAAKFRHPRCTTCHAMAVPNTLSFASSPLPHAGPPPGVGFPVNDPNTCAPCHVTSTNVPVPGWQAPAASFDLRDKTVAQLAQAAQGVPIDETEHFVTDKRVLWALDSGVLPQVGGGNGAGDDDHDGILEPEDTDGISRPVPGGSARFIEQIEDWIASGRVVTAAAAVRDVTLVSRAVGGAAAGNGASTLPRVVWVPNPTFNPSSAATAAATNPVGRLFVVYQSEATNLAAGDTNGVQDVFRTIVELRVEEDVDGSPLAGGLNLRTVDSTLLCSTVDGSGAPGNAASGRPVIGGANGEWIAFESAATNLVGGFSDQNGAGTDVFVRLASINQTQLVSHAVGNAATGGNGSSEAPSIDPTGVAVAFESDASDLIALDTNGVRDVFVARVDSGSPFTKVRASVGEAGAEGTGGGSRSASVHVDQSLVRVAFESDKTDLAAGLVAPTNVFLFASDSGTSVLLNQLISPTASAIGNGSARRPVFGQNGAVVAFESDARNIDTLRPDGNPDTDVFLVETAQAAAGRVLPYRISVTNGEAADADGASTQPTFGTFAGASGFGVGIAAYRTTARNLGTSDGSDIMVTFVDETSGVLAAFDATPTLGAAPLQVQFTDNSSGLPTSWEWDFDNDGTIDSTEQNPTFTYTTPGLYTVRLVARNANSDGTVTRTDLVRVTGPVTAEFTQSATTGPVPLTVVFTDQSTEPFGSITAWAWDFNGDGVIDSTQQNPAFDFTLQGTFSVTLTATGEGGTGTITKTNLIVVQPPGPVTANFTSVRSGYDTDPIQFTDTSTGIVTAWAWDFDNDNVIDSTLQNPTFTFTTPGTYTVSLTVTGPGGSDIETKPNWFTSVPSSVSVSIGASQDTSIYSDATGNSNGANDQIVCGNAATLAAVNVGVRRALVAFDVASAVPANSTVLAASLRLACTFNPTNPTGPETIALRRLTRGWTEGSSNGGIGLGTAASGNDATWSNATSGGSPTAWTTPGGDFVGSVSASTVVDTAGTYNWATNATMVSDVQGWLDTPSSNAGWILRANETPGQRSAKVFGSRQRAAANERPQLTITYRPPLP